MNFVSHQDFCFASLAEMASRCSSDQLPKSVRATLLQLMHCVKPDQLVNPQSDQSSLGTLRAWLLLTVSEDSDQTAHIAKTDMSLCLAHISICRFCHVLAHYIPSYAVYCFKVVRPSICPSKTYLFPLSILGEL